MLERLITPRPDPTASEQGFDLREIFNFIWRQWRFIATIVVVAFIIGVGWIAKETPLYTSSVQILLDTQREKAGGADTILAESILNPAVIESQISIIRSTEFLRRVVERQQLASDPEFGAGDTSNTSISGIVRSYLPGDVAPKQAQVPNQTSQQIPPNVLAAIGKIKNAIAVRREGQSYIISIAGTSKDPVRSAKLANEVADAYIVDQLDARFDAAQRASTWLNDRLTELRKQLRDSEEAVATFRTEHGISQSSNVTLNQQQLSDLNARLVTARALTSEKKSRYELLRSIEAKGGNALSLPDVAGTGTLGVLRAQTDSLSQKEADLLSRYSANHPLVINLAAERRDVQRALTAEIQRVSANIKNEYELAKAREQALENSLNQVTGQTPLDNATSIRLRELERTADVNKTLFEDYLRRAKVTEEQSTFTPRQARVITYALPSYSPSYPIKVRVISIALAIGLIIGIGGAVARELLDTSFTSARQVEEVLQIPVLASVSKIDPRELNLNGKQISLPLFTITKPLSRYSEAFRALRSGIQMTDVDNPPKIIQFTSTLPGEGKTTLALSFAAGAAQAGLKILFIDCDLRRPSASTIVGMQKQAGLVDLLISETSANEAIKYYDDMKLWILPAGSKTQNPSDLLGSERMKMLSASFRKSFDYVVIDTPPLGPVIDPIVVSQLVDKVIFVVRWGTTPREMVRQSILQIPGHKKIAGVLFNRIVDAEAQKYGKYGYSYYYGSRYYKNYYSE